MKYDKPLIVLSVDSVTAVQNSDPQTKGPSSSDHLNSDEATIAAYEADE